MKRHERVSKQVQQRFRVFFFLSTEARTSSFREIMLQLTLWARSRARSRRDSIRYGQTLPMRVPKYPAGPKVAW